MSKAKTFYFRVSHPLFRFVGVSAEYLCDAKGDLQMWLLRDCGFHSAVKIVETLTRKPCVEFIHQFGTPEWMRIAK